MTACQAEKTLGIQGDRGREDHNHPGAQSLGEEKFVATESYNSTQQKSWQRTGL